MVFNIVDALQFGLFLAILSYSIFFYLNLLHETIILFFVLIQQLLLEPRVILQLLQPEIILNRLPHLLSRIIPMLHPSIPLLLIILEFLVHILLLSLLLPLQLHPVRFAQVLVITDVKHLVLVLHSSLVVRVHKLCVRRLVLPGEFHAFFRRRG